MISEHRRKQEQKLSVLHSSVAAAIQAGIEEYDRTFIEPNPVLTTAIAKGIRQFQPGKFCLLSTRTDLEAYKRQVSKLISESVFEVEMKPLLPDIDPSAIERSVFKVEKRNPIRENSRKLKCIKLYILLSVIVLLAGIYIYYSPDVKCIVSWHQNMEGDMNCSKVIQTNTYCNGTMNFTSGEILSYSGEWLNGLQHGNGVGEYRSGEVYNGNWVEGKRQGFGQSIYYSSRFEGQWNDDKRDGYGRSFQSKDYFSEGYFNERGVNGFGLISYLKNEDEDVFRYTYIGEINNGIEKGIGFVFINQTLEYAGCFWRSYSVTCHSKNLTFLSSDCKSIKEYQIEFLFGSEVEEIGSNSVSWGFKMMSHFFPIYLVGMHFDAEKVPTYLESITILFRGKYILSENYTLEERREIGKEVTAIKFSKEIVIDPDAIYLVETTVSQPNYTMAQIYHEDSKSKSYEKFSFFNKTPSYFRGFIYRRDCFFLRKYGTRIY